ncbi:AI-2E family transporter [Mucilaginibacter terrenus]|uniref:AI-2E family transporter n=1 Tax=Mucilaginibacter terrenus TaxID=2482727 RepID=A0A3E2NUH9_9SPHI|nr:AI-2E family transporter [Mucilaginibacter terrenus]RFZ84510.1 AI-2E family transporter [Mucilaginibacter terrenus]
MDIADQKPAPRPRKELTYIEKVWHTVAIVALLVVVILIARVAFNVLLMVLAATLISTYFHGLGNIIQRKTGWSRKVAMSISVGGSFAIVGVLLWFIGARLQMQVAQLSHTLPSTISAAREKLSETPIGQQVLTYFDDNSGKIFITAQHFFSTSFGVLGNIYIIVFLALFFTASPSVYKNGFMILIPEKKKELWQCIMNRVNVSLKGWLKGMLLSMVLIFVMLTIGLTIMGIPAVLVLALFAGMLKIIPNFGSLVAMIPGVLLALTVSTNTAVIVALIYIVSQTIVSNIVTPIIQNKIINLPPALTIISQVIMGTLSGALGIILAVPLLAITVILADELYVKKINVVKRDVNAENVPLTD